MQQPLIVIQARMGSTRYPGKVLADLAGRSVLAWVIRAAEESGAGKVVVATTHLEEDGPIASESEGLGIPVVRGDPVDVLARYVQCLDEYGDRPVVRLTADCPLLDPALIETCVAIFHGTSVDYASTTLTRTLPRGLDVEVISSEALRVAASEASSHHRSHVTSYVYSHPDRFRLAGLTFNPDGSHLRVTLDTPDDLTVIRGVVEKLGDRCMSWFEVILALETDPDLASLNAHVVQKDLTEG